jgi:o-succinylbenzoate synthase
VSALAGIDRIVAFSAPLVHRFRQVDERHGLLLHGPEGWGEWSPFDEYSDDVAADWLAAALDSAVEPSPDAVRERIPVNVTVPAVGPDIARSLVARAGASTVKVKVAEPGETLAEDLARVAAVRDALGTQGTIRIDANAAWSVEAAVRAIPRLAEVAGGLEYVEQPCLRLEELAEVRRCTGVAIAADESIRRAHADPGMVREAVDVAIVKIQPSGGIRAALALAERLAMPVVVSSALETSVGLAAGVRFAAALPQLDHACGLGTAGLLQQDVTTVSLRPQAGWLATSDAAPDMTLRDAVPGPDAATRRWLHARLERAAAILDRRRAAEPGGSR